MSSTKQVISQSLRDDFEKEVREVRRQVGGNSKFDVADVMAAFDRIFEVAKPIKG